MIETADGIKSAAEIAATPGVDCVYIGPSDLSISLGLPHNQDPRSKLYNDTVADIVKACRNAGVAVGIQSSNGTFARQNAEMGVFDMITVASDGPLFSSSIKSHITEARGKGEQLGSGPNIQLLSPVSSISRCVNLNGFSHLEISAASRPA